MGKYGAVPTGAGSKDAAGGDSNLSTKGAGADKEGEEVQTKYADMTVLQRLVAGDGTCVCLSCEKITAR